VTRAVERLRSALGDRVAIAGHFQLGPLISGFCSTGTELPQQVESSEVPATATLFRQGGRVWLTGETSAHTAPCLMRFMVTDTAGNRLEHGLMMLSGDDGKLVGRCPLTSAEILVLVRAESPESPLAENAPIELLLEQHLGQGEARRQVDLLAFAATQLVDIDCVGPAGPAVGAARAWSGRLTPGIATPEGCGGRNGNSEMRNIQARVPGRSTGGPRALPRQEAQLLPVDQLGVARQQSSERRLPAPTAPENWPVNTVVPNMPDVSRTTEKPHRKIHDRPR
jgi:hypothetical protein